VAAQEVFQNIHGHVGPLLQPLGEVLADHPAPKGLVQELVEASGLKVGIRSHR